MTITNPGRLHFSAKSCNFSQLSCMPAWLQGPLPPPHLECIHSFVVLIEALLAAGFPPAPAGLELRQRPQLWEVVPDGGAPPALPVPAWALGCLR